MASSPTEDYGRRLLPSVIDKAALTDPDHIVYSFTKTDHPADGFHRVSNRRYADAVNRVAWFIEDGFGKADASSFPSIGYIGPSTFSSTGHASHSFVADLHLQTTSAIPCSPLRPSRLATL